MGFWGTLGKIGKVAAPIAAGAFGGPAAAMAVGAGVNALDKKMHGGKAKDILGAAAGGAMDNMGGLKIGKVPIAMNAGGGGGIGPSSGVLGKLKGAIPQIADQAMGAIGRRDQQQVPNQNAPSGTAVGRAMAPSGGAYQDNSARNLQMGRRNAIADQPFRRGYNVNMAGADAGDGTMAPPTQERMPPIYPNRGGFGGYNGGGFGDVGVRGPGGGLRGGGFRNAGMIGAPPVNQTTQPVGGGQIAPEDQGGGMGPDPVAVAEMMKRFGGGRNMNRPQAMY